MSDTYGTVYFIGPEKEGPVKIGFTSDRNPIGRLRQLQTGHPESLLVLGVVESSLATERAIHKFLTLHLVRGEWFEREPTLALLRRLEFHTLGHNSTFARQMTFLTDRLLISDTSSPQIMLARHLVADMANRLMAINTAMPLPFRSWLLLQAVREDPIGDLAKDVAGDIDFPSVGTLADYSIYFENKDPRPAEVRAMLDAWIECDTVAANLPYKQITKQEHPSKEGSQATLAV